MSTFAVTIEVIDKVWPHDNADRLQMASVVGMEFEFVVVRGKFIPGDKVVYFPVDSILRVDITAALGLSSNRIRTIRLRGNISQGIVCFPTEVGLTRLHEGDVTEELQVVKYDPPPVFTKAANLVPLPELVSRYDIEGAQNFPETIELLLDRPCTVTEKLEGSHWAATIYPSGEIAVSQRNFRIIPIAGHEHAWHRVLHEQKLDEVLRSLKVLYNGAFAVTIRGEILGPKIQGNIYKRKSHVVYLFNIEIDGIPVPPDVFSSHARFWDFMKVPKLSLTNITLRNWLGGRTVAEASDGISALSDTRREGIVIQYGDIIIKQRSPEYLAKSDL